MHVICSLTCHSHNKWLIENAKITHLHLRKCLAWRKRSLLYNALNSGSTVKCAFSSTYKGLWWLVVVCHSVVKHWQPEPLLQFLATAASFAAFRISLVAMPMFAASEEDGHELWVGTQDRCMYPRLQPVTVLLTIMPLCRKSWTYVA